MTYSTIDTATAKMSELKEFAKSNGFTPLGNKSLKSVWVAAVDFYLESQILIETVKTEVVETYQEADLASEVVAIEIENVVIEVVNVLTSDLAIDIYKTALRSILLLIILACFAIGKVTLLMWNNKEKTAVYSWIQQFNNSKIGYRIRCELLVLILLVTVKLDDVKAIVYSWIESNLSRIGLVYSPLLNDLEMM